jgi:hypothetical protein
MRDPNEFVGRYMALWNTPEERQRRDAVAGLWAPDGLYVDPSIVAQGHDDLYKTATAVHNEFVWPGKHIFRSRQNAQSHHNIVRFNWELADLDAGSVVDRGFDLLVLADGRIAADYRFADPPEADDRFSGLIQRYVALWQEPDAELRWQAIAELWAPEGGQTFPASDPLGGEPTGHQALYDRVTRSYDLFIRDGQYAFRSLGDANGHHNLVRFDWKMIHTATGETADVGFELFVLADDGRIQSDYQFVGPADLPGPVAQSEEL